MTNDKRRPLAKLPEKSLVGAPRAEPCSRSESGKNASPMKLFRTAKLLDCSGKLGRRRHGDFSLRSEKIN